MTWPQNHAIPDAWRRQPLTSISVEPSTEPLTLTEAKLYLRVTHSSEDALITGLITAARIYCETKTRRAFVTKTITQQFRGFFDMISPLVLSHAPVASVSSVTYVDGDGASQTLSSAWYRLVSQAGQKAGRAFLEPTDAFQMPTLDATRAYPVTVTTVCGYGSASAVPDGIKAAMYLMIAEMYETRSESTEKGLKSQTTVDRLLAPYVLPEAA